MSREKDKPTQEQIKDIADRAEGIKPAQAEPTGRPTSYQPAFAAQAEKLCKLAATDAELADFFQVSTRTIYRWQNEFPEFCQSLKSGKAEADERVERSLYHRAVGYTFEAEKVFQYKGEIVRAETKEHVPPDTTACIFWLKNRRSQQWRDIHRLEHGQPGDFDRLSDDELHQQVLKEAKALGVPVPAMKANGANGTQH